MKKAEAIIMLRYAVEDELARHVKIRVVHVGGTDDICSFCQRPPRAYSDRTWPCPSASALQNVLDATA